MKINRGHIYTADLSPRYGTEPGKMRPVVVIQTDLINTDHPSTLICPLTTQVRPKVEILRLHLKKGIAGLDKDSDILIDQVRAIDNKRFKKSVGKLPASTMKLLKERLMIVMDLN